MIGHRSLEKIYQHVQNPKTVFYFLRADPINTASVTVTRKRVNVGDGQGLQIPCTILFKEEEKYIKLNLHPL